MCLIFNPIKTLKLAACISDSVSADLCSLKEERKGSKEKIPINNLMILKRDH